MARRIEIKADENGGPDVMTVEEVPESDRLDAMMGEDSPVVAKSAAAARLAALRARRGAIVEAFEFDGETWFLKRLNWEDVTEVFGRTMREGGSINLNHPYVFRSFVAAVIQCATVSALNDTTPFFNPESYQMPDAMGVISNTTELEQWMAEPESKSAVDKLFDALTDLNPDLWPQKKSVEELIQAMNQVPPMQELNSTTMR